LYLFLIDGVTINNTYKNEILIASNFNYV